MLCHQITCVDKRGPGSVICCTQHQKCNVIRYDVRPILSIDRKIHRILWVPLPTFTDKPTDPIPLPSFRYCKYQVVIFISVCNSPITFGQLDLELCTFDKLSNFNNVSIEAIWETSRLLIFPNEIQYITVGWYQRPIHFMHLALECGDNQKAL